MDILNKPPALLIFAGLDPCGASGLTADIQTATALGVHPLCVATLLTTQSLHQFSDSQEVDTNTLRAQTMAADRDFDIQAVKIGAIGSPDMLATVANLVSKINPAHVVADPVRATTSGGSLAASTTVTQLRDALLSLRPVLTPNKQELLELTEGSGDADLLIRAGARAVLVTDGDGDGIKCVHHLYQPNAERLAFSHERIDGAFRGTGCTLSTAIAAQLSMGRPLPEAVQLALDFTLMAIRQAHITSADGTKKIPARRVHT